MEKPSPSWGTGSAFRAFSSGLSSRSSKIRVMWTPKGAGAFASWGGSVGFFSVEAGGTGLLSTPLAWSVTGFSALGTSGVFSGEGADLGAAGTASPQFLLLGRRHRLLLRRSRGNRLALNALGRGCDWFLRLGHFWVFLRSGGFRLWGRLFRLLGFLGEVFSAGASGLLYWAQRLSSPPRVVSSPQAERVRWTKVSC